MKRFVCVCLVLLLFVSTAVAEVPNADTLAIYKQLAIGSWECMTEDIMSMSGLYLKMEITEENYGSWWMLFVSSENVVYFTDLLNNKASSTAIITFTEDGDYMMLYREGVGGYVYQRK